MRSGLDVDDGLDRPLTDRDLGLLQLSTVLYYLHETNPDNGLVRDKTDPNAPVSIAAVGMALATIPVVVRQPSCTTTSWGFASSVSDNESLGSRWPSSSIDRTPRPVPAELSTRMRYVEDRWR